MNFLLSFFLSIYIFFFPKIANATIITSLFNNSNTSLDFWNMSIQAFGIFSLLSFIPAIILMMTSFTRIIIVFGLLKNALGTPSAPPNQILIGLSLFLTFFIMSPTLEKVYHNAYVPYSQEQIDFSTAIKFSLKPFHKFMRKQTRKSDIMLFCKLAKNKYPEKESQIPFRILLPAYMISELKTAFQIGFLIFLPFLVIDLIVASVLMSLGMMMITPTTISLPIKLILFVLSDGWNLLILSLSKSFFL
ncbi:flagellar type III secretion system pore protein FliP [Buchnera aphidicola]|uniref:Flagellar biosynthetic protein FliP n=1 Tax=Buchnera aphidicola subsp. Tuberolachnus salignus TaxID=98804 RepID=A0A160SX40_BUCTT|nr:flagellar type III secretion system pore protein FliP [Buchnera aphidicola]CUR53035.1 Flagellar biosynthetic protein FliP [Buchnera aphidicola (Tuberolachnus salignus)]